MKIILISIFVIAYIIWLIVDISKPKTQEELDREKSLCGLSSEKPWTEDDNWDKNTYI